MRPFQASYPQFGNQQQQVANANPSGMNMNNMCNNQRPSHSNTPHFPVQSNNPMSNANGNFLSAQNPHFANGNSYQQVPMQNMQMGFPQAQFFPQNVAPQCHGHHHINPQNMIMPQPNPQFLMNNRPQITNMPYGQFNLQNLPPHGQFPQQNLGFPQVNQFNMPPFMPRPLGCVNQGAQNVGFQMNPQSGMMNTNQFPHNAQGQNMFVPSTMGQNPLQVSSMNGQHAQVNSVNGSHAQFAQTQNGMHSGGLGQVQGNNAKDNGSNISNANQTNPQGNGSTRFQKPGTHPMSNTKGNFKSFKGKGPNDKGPRNFNLAKCTTSVESPSPRTLPLNYSEDEIQKWRAERRKNHPSRPKSEKTQSEIIADDAQTRRQELKQILAKQAELGIEVAEIPKHYLLDNQPEQKETSNGNGKSRFEKSRKRGGKRQKHNRFNKKQKTNSSSQKPEQRTVKKKPSLLEKLLSGDIKRDKSHLLQAFRFMALNNFFGEYPKKALEFPLVKVNDTKKALPLPLGEGNGGVSAIKKMELVDDDENGEVVCEEVKEREGGKEEGSEVEEGELTD